MISDIIKTSKTVKPRTLESVHLMICEEMGELARAINRPARCKETALEELCDVLICVVDLMWLINPKATEEQITDERFLMSFNSHYVNKSILSSYYYYNELFRDLSEIDIYHDWTKLNMIISSISVLFVALEDKQYSELLDLISTTIHNKCEKWKTLTC